MTTLTLVNGLAILATALLLYGHYTQGLNVPPELLLLPIGVGMLATVALTWRMYRRTRQAFDQVTTMIQQTAEGQVDLTTPAPCVEADALMTSLIYMASRFDDDKQTILAAQQKSDQAAQAKSDFLSTMSHEIRTPMNGVLGMAGLLAETKLTGEQQNYLNAIRDSGETLLMVINDILDFSRLEEGRLGIELTPFNLTRTVESVSELLSPSAHAKDVEISTYVSPQIPTMLRGDVARFRQILTNLIGNAIKFTTQGAVMTEVFLESQGPHTVILKVQVTDTGIGVEPAACEQIFERFTQADVSISRQFGGTGLGLAICKRLVNLMGGDIGVSSTPGEGSTFYFTLPLQKADEEAPETALASVAGKRVLVADDHNFNRYIFQRQLEKLGLDCTLVSDGPSAITALVNAQARENTPFDLAIIDHIMPNMNGEEVAEYIRVQPQFADLKLILASSKNLSGATPRFKELGFDYVLTKPVREETLIRTVTNLLASTTDEDPAALEEASTSVLEAALTSLQDIHVLLVEDNHMNQLFTTTLLKKHFPNIYTAADGVEALNMVGKINFDLILMDISMPNMDGLAATKAIRKLPSFAADTPIIAVTATVEEAEHQKYLAAGMNDIILKPVNKSDLLQTIVRHLTQPASNTDDEEEQKSA
jgi:hypothetical protein